MIVDSAVWIDHFRGRETQAVTKFRTALRTAKPVLLTPAILQEVLQGTSDAAQFARYERLLAPIPFVSIAGAREVAVTAARLYAKLRWQGATVPSLDCVIAAEALLSGEPLLSSDSDFAVIRSIEPRLRLLIA